MTSHAGLLELAVDLAHRAGRLLVERRPPGDLAVETKSSPTDVVTVMDTAAERLIFDALRVARPDDGFLGEEGGSSAGSTGVRWVVDPIDGTVNYLYEIPAWAVSIAAEVDGEVVAGVVYNPSLDETFTAMRGAGASLDGARLRVGDAPELSQALVATGFGYAVSRRAHQASVARHVIPRVRDIRRMGAASLDLCAVACGRVDAYYERGLSPWDLAAGGLIAREAGARVEGLRGTPAGAGMVLAAPDGLFQALHDLLEPLEPDRD